MILTDRELVEAILSDPRRREAVHQIIRMMLDLEAERGGNLDARYEVVVVGRQVTSAIYQRKFSKTLPERVHA